MFGKIGDFIKPLLPSSDKMPGQPVSTVRPTGEDQQPGQKDSQAFPESSAKPATETEKEKLRFSEGDDTFVSLDAIRSFFLQQQPSYTAPPENTPETYRAAVNAYTKKSAAPLPQTDSTVANSNTKSALEKIDLLRAQGITRIPLKLGQSFEEALENASTHLPKK